MDRIPTTPYPELPSVVERLLGGVRTVLADNFVGAYLVGSLATGDFDLDSDVDFIVLINFELTGPEVQSLQAMHADMHSLDCYPAKHLEGSYLRKDSLSRADVVGIEPVWYLDNGSIFLERSTHDNQWHVRWVLRERAIKLAGPDPEALMQPIPLDVLRVEMVTAMDGLQRHFVSEMEQPLAYFNTKFGQSFTVLTVCRILHTLQSGTVESKRAGVLWAKHKLDPEWHELIQQAWIEREGVRFCLKIRQHAGPETLRRTAEFIDYGKAEARRYQREHLDNGQ